MPSTILVVDDYSDNRILLATWLRTQGYQVLEASDGKEGLLEANRSNPDLILMDLAMPGLDGIEATRQLRGWPIHARTPIFAISAYITADVRAAALAAGCDEVFSKPLDLTLLLSRIELTLEGNSIGVKHRTATVN
ncbi:MAG TPA: response regulator [Pyrinomonadaceae bacterium]|nr:response regulator [Pyrinomonadaceae bacterium]